MFERDCANRESRRCTRRRAAALSALVILGASSVRAVAEDIPPGGITTVVGATVNYKSYGFSGDGGPANQAQLWQPRAVDFDSAGNLYIADTLNERIRKVDPAGTITTLAGNGSTGYSGDGGPATQATFRDPHGVAVDSAGNVYIADSVNNRIRRVDPAGIITTFAGRGRGNGGDGGQAKDALLADPKTMSMDPSDNLYFVDAGNDTVRRIDLHTGIITTVAGTGLPGFSGDGGPANLAAMKQPKGVWVTSAGDLYIADTDNNRVRKVDKSGVMTTVAGTGAAGFGGDGGPAKSAKLNDPRGVAVDPAGNVYIGEEKGQRVRKVDTSGVISTVAGTGVGGYSGDGGPATQARIRNLRGIAADSLGQLFIADCFNNRIRKIRL
jgi:streptogramin lyase